MPNKKYMKYLFRLFFVTFISTNVFSQAASYTDPAQAYLRLMLEKGGTEVVRIGSFKVTGTPYLFGEKNDGNVFTPSANTLNVQVSYNTYSQAIEIVEQGKSAPFILENRDVDSFYLKVVNQENISQPLFFVHGKYIYSKEKQFFQLVYKGSQFSLYKKYYATLGYVGTNYIQSDLRQFDLNFDYYYTNQADQKIKKLKLSSSAIQKEFKTKTGITEFFQSEEFSNNPEQALIKVFQFLNN
jgi:hypothetical protein